jgi:DUF971 family protein
MTNKPKKIPPDFPLTNDVRVAAFAAARLNGETPRKALVTAVLAEIHQVVAKGIDMTGIKIHIDDQHEFASWNKEGSKRWSIRLHPVARKYTPGNQRKGSSPWIYDAVKGASFSQSLQTGEFAWGRLRSKLLEQAAWLAKERDELSEQEASGFNDPLRISKTLRAEYPPSNTDVVPMGDTAAVVVPVTTVAQGRILMHGLKKLGLL